ncbi:MAG: cation-translocating P-type ATPase [Chloroflexi bacterium]|nr:cation-translocating P-type ATPase [Chloroflexota bacterium]
MKPLVWHTLAPEETFQALETGPQGLSPEEARSRLLKFGPNLLREEKRASPFMLFLEQFKNFLIIILLVAVVLSFFLGETWDAALILVIVLFAAGLGFVQEYRAERALEALKRMAAPTASVLRRGEEKEIPASELVPGDIVVLRTGDRVAADLRLVEAVNLRTDEASLTGESLPVEKVVGSLAEADLPVGDRKNMAYMGTAAVYGRGKGGVVATGMATEFGRIAGMLQQVEESPTPLQVNLDRMGRVIGIGALAMAALIFGLALLQREGGFLEMFIWAVSLAVAAVPEALPAVVTISLALGVQRLVKRHALIRRLPAVETLGSVSVICSDKTGTLTQDQMTVRRIYTDGQMIEVTGAGYEPRGEFRSQGPLPEGLRRLLLAGVLCNDSCLCSNDGSWWVRGDPTEGALVVAAAKAGIGEEVREKYPRMGEVPFSSERKRMTTIHRTEQGEQAFSKGAPEVILESCSHVLKGGEESPLGPQACQEVLAQAQEMAGEALRVLGLAYKHLGRGEAEAEKEMVFLGLVGMIDPPRSEVKEAIARCLEAGIKPVMITGDHAVTARAIAQELGILRGGLVLTGPELERLGEVEFEAMAERVEVYARVSPAHKLRVVDALTKKGHVVAMTGDGVNDAPALKKADIGVAMGITGTDVSKEASDMVLTDDNFASIVAAVEEGRGIFGNIKKYLMYLLSSNLGEILLMLLAVSMGLPLPLVAVQILFVNLATDGLPALALAVDPPARDIMRRPPRPRKQGIFTWPVLSLMGAGGVWSGLVNLGVFVWALKSGRTLVEAQGLTFLSLTFIQYFKAFNFRSDTLSLFQIGIFSNRWLWWAILVNMVITIPIIYLPALQGPFHTFSLGLRDWGVVLLASFSVFPVLEFLKFLSRRSLARRGQIV